MSSHSGDELDQEPPSINPYEVLGLAREATSDQVKRAYRKAALKHHPDKVTESEKESAHQKFQEVAFAYAILSDPTRRKRYDATGSTAESILDSDGFNWTDYYKEQFKDSISADAIEKFSKKYKGSEEEKDDVLAAYEEFEGDMDGVYSTVMLSHPPDDEERFQKIIRDAIEKGEVQSFKKFTKESKAKRNKRMQEVGSEGQEAMEYAKELGVHDKLFGGDKKGAKSKSNEDDLAAMILKRQKDREANGASFLDRIAEKYGAGDGAGGKKGRKKRAQDDEPDEAAFQATRAKLDASRTAKVAGQGGKRSKR